MSARHERPNESQLKMVYRFTVQGEVVVILNTRLRKTCNILGVYSAMKEVVQQTSLCEVIESNLYEICSIRQVVLRNYYKYLLNISLFD